MKEEKKEIEKEAEKKKEDVKEGKETPEDEPVVDGTKRDDSDDVLKEDKKP